MNCHEKPVFTNKQIKICAQCRYASGNTQKLAQGKQFKTTPVCQKHRCAIEPMVKINHQYPSLIEQGSNLVKDSIKVAKSGFKLRCKDEINRRRNICLSCAEGYDPAQNRCKLCGCCVSIKTLWQSMSCPRGKW